MSEWNPDVSLTICPEKEALLKARVAASNTYAEAATVLGQNAGKVTRARFYDLYVETSETRLRAKSARLSYEQHVASHGC